MTSKIGEIARFEMRYRLRQPSTYLYAAAFLWLPVIAMEAFSDSPRPLNSPLMIATMVALIGMVGMMVSAGLFSDAATRDETTGMAPLFYTTPITRWEYLGGRYLGALAVNAALLLLISVGLLLGMKAPMPEDATFGPFIPGAYVEALLLIALPNMIVTSAILFTIAAVSRMTLPAYLAVVGTFAGYLFATELQASMANRQLAMLLDPFGAVLLQEVARDLPAAEQDVVRIAGMPILWLNRLLWLGVGAATLALLGWLFRFQLAAGGGRRARKPQADADPTQRAQAVARPAVARTFDGRTTARQLRSIAWRALSDILASRIFRIVLAANIVMIFAFGWDVGTMVFDTSTWPLTHLVASVMRGPAALAVLVLIGLYAGELVWKERDARVAEIADTEPVATWVPLVAKFIALVGMILALQATSMVAGILLQIVRGYYRFELGVYAQFLFGFMLSKYVLVGALAMVLHVLVNQKHVGHLVVALSFIFVATPAAFGVRHKLLAYASEPGWIYSDMNGFGPYTGPFVWVQLYWAAWALLLGALAVLSVTRGTEGGWRHRLREVRARLTSGLMRTSAIALGLILGLGGFVYYNTNVLNEYRAPGEDDARAAEYERTFGKFERTAQPVIVGAKLRVEIFPDRGAVDIVGTYRLVNRTLSAIDSVHVVSRNVEVRSTGFDRAARLIVDDQKHRYRIYALEQPLLPGDSVTLTFDHAIRRRGFPNSGISTSVVENGASFDRRWLPRIGYQPGLALADPEERKKHGLPPRSEPGLEDTVARQYRFENRDADLVDVDVVIGTAGDQIAVTPGMFVRNWSEHGRSYFHYQTEAPLPFGAPILSARYAVKEYRWNDVSLRIYHHPTHTFNLDRMVRSMRASLAYFSEQFGPYQFGELRIVEFPRYANFARAHPHTIAFSEGGSFLTRVRPGDVDRTFFVTAHETAHQWWGGQVTGARVAGAALLSETLAQYGAMMVMEKTYGREHVKKFYDFEMDRYLRGRNVSRGTEVPLLRVRDQSYLYYHKGAVAMYTLKEHIGEERVNRALRRYLDKWQDAGPPYPTSLDLYKELRTVTPDSLQSLLVDFFETITLWHVGVSKASAERVGPAEYRVTLQVEGKKLRSDSVGNETETPMNDLVEIGVFARAAPGKPLGEPLYLRRHRITGGRQTITVTVKSQPVLVGVDPHNRLIQRAKEGKVVVLQTVTRRRGGDSGAWRAEFRARKRDSSSVRVKLRGL